MFKAKTTILGFSLALFSLSGCAPNPTRIEPKAVPVAAYASRTCDELSTLHNADLSRLQSDEVEQRSTRRSDAWGVALFGLPIGRMAGGNRADEIAELKGELIAVDSTFSTHHCPGMLIGKAE